MTDSVCSIVFLSYFSVPSQGKEDSLLVFQVEHKEDVLHQLVIALEVKQLALLWPALGVGVGNLLQDEANLCTDKDEQ